MLLFIYFRWNRFILLLLPIMKIEFNATRRRKKYVNNVKFNHRNYAFFSHISIIEILHKIVNAERGRTMRIIHCILL